MAAVGAADSAGDVAAHGDLGSLGCCCNFLEAIEGFCNAAVDVLLGEGLAGGAKDGNLVCARCDCALKALRAQDVCVGCKYMRRRSAIYKISKQLVMLWESVHQHSRRTLLYALCALRTAAHGDASVLMQGQIR
jgi:hypothetical protein